MDDTPASQTLVPMALDTPATAVRHDDPINNARNKYQFVLVVPESTPNGHIVTHRASNSLRELQPFTVVLKTNTHTLPDRVSLLKALTFLQLPAAKRQRARTTLEYHPANTFTTGAQLSVLQSIAHYRPFGPCDLAMYYRLVLRGHPPEHKGSIFARSGPYNCLPDIMAYARLSQDWNRAFQLEMGIAWHAWCLANDRFVVYQPDDDKFSELMPPYCKVFFRTDFTSPKDLPSPLALPEVEMKKIQDKTLDFWEVARRVDATTFMLHVREYVAFHYPRPSKNNEGKHSKFLNLCCRDWINGMRTLRHRQAPVVGVVQHVQENLSSSVERVSNRRKKPALPIRWETRGSTKDPAIDQLDLKLSRPDGNNESKAKRPDNVLEAMLHTVPYVFHALGMEPFQAILDTTGVRSAPGIETSPDWILDMLQLMSLHGSRSGREITNIERGVRSRNKRKVKEDDKTKEEASATAENSPASTLRLEPRIPESRLFYTFSMQGDGELHHRSPLPSVIDSRDIVHYPRDVTTPSNWTLPAFLHLLHHGRDVLFSSQGQIIRDGLRIGVRLESTVSAMLPNPVVDTLLFAPTQTTPGIYGYHDGFVVYREHIPLIFQAQPVVELSAKFADFVSKQQFMRYFTRIPSARPGQISREATALRLFKNVVALRCLIKNEADVLATLASRFRVTFMDPRSKQFRQDIFFGHLQLGDFLYRAHVTFNVRTAYAILPALRTGIKENYTTKPLTASRSFKLPEYGLLETKHMEEWVSRHIGLKLVCAQVSLHLVRIFNQVRQLTPSTESDAHAQQILLADLCLFVVVNIRRRMGNDKAAFEDHCGFLGTEEQKEILSTPQVLVSFELSMFDDTTGQIIHPPRKLVYTQTLFTATNTIADWFYNRIVWPTLQFVALATVPVPVLYEHRPIHKPTKATTVNWTQLSRLCRQAPLEKEIDRISRDIRGAATALAVKYGKEPTSAALLTLLRTQTGLVGRLPHHRLVTVTALIDSLCSSDRKVERDRDAAFQVEYSHFIQQAIAAGGGGAAENHTMNAKSVAPTPATVATAVSSFTKVQCNCAQELLFSLQKPASPLSPDAVAAVCQRLTHDENNSRDLPQHPLDRLHAAFRLYYTQSPTAKQSTILTNLNQTLELSASSRVHGSGSRTVLLDSLTASSVKRLRDLIVTKPRPAPMPTVQAKLLSPKPRATTATPKSKPVPRGPATPKPSALVEPVQLPTPPAGIVMATIVSSQPPITATAVAAIAVPQPPPSPPKPAPPPAPAPEEPPAGSPNLPVRVAPIIVPRAASPVEVDYGEDEDEETLVPTPAVEEPTPLVVVTPVPVPIETPQPPPQQQQQQPPLSVATDTQAESSPVTPATPLTPADPEFKELPERPRSNSRSRSSASAVPPTNHNKRGRSRSPLQQQQQRPYTRPFLQIDRIRSSSPKRARTDLQSPRYSHTIGIGNGSRDRERERDRDGTRRSEYTPKELHSYLDERVRDSRNYDPSRRKPLQFHDRIVR